MAKEYKWGYIGKDGEFAIEPHFDDAWDFHEGLAVVKVEWARGYIDREGKYVIEPKFQYAGPFVEGRAIVQLDDLWGQIDRSGNWVEAPTPDRPANVPGFTPQVGAPSTEPEFSEGLAPMPKGKKTGYIDPTGKYVIKPRFIQAKPFSEGLAAVLVSL